MATNNSFWILKGGVDYVDEWFLMQSFYPTALITAAYLMFVLKLGPLYMKGRRPYTLRNCLLVYNLCQVIFSAVIFFKVSRMILKNGLFEKPQLGCMINADSPQHMKTKYELLSLHHLYYLAKITELFDTVFFVLRKKWSQISFLHVYHHSVVTVFAWIGLKYEPAYSYLLLGFLNSFVHIIMYAYYGLSAFPKLNKYLWWKKYLTKMQMAQFLALLVHMIANSYVTNCPSSKIVIILYVAHMTLFIYLFGQFYVQSYLKKKHADEDLKAKEISAKIGKSKLNQEKSFKTGIRSELNSEKSR